MFSASRLRTFALTLALCAGLGSVRPALAADIWCGHDDDEGGTITNCTGNDKDHDGYTTDGTGSQYELVSNTDIDCDDTNWKISTNAWVDAGGGTVKRCKSDGTYTSAKLVSTLTASDISSTCSSLIFLDDAGLQTLGCGTTSATACDYRCVVDTGRACYIAPSTSNDCFWWLPGTYNSAATVTADGDAQMLYVNNKDGSALHPIINVADPTGTVLLDSPGTSSVNDTKIIRLTDSDYWKFYGFNLGNGWSEVGLWINGSSNTEFAFGKIYSIDGAAGNNTSGASVNGANNWIHQTLFKDNFDTTAPTNEDNSDIVAFGGANNRFSFNSLLNSSTASFGAIKVKRGEASTSMEIIGNHIQNFWHLGIGFAAGGAIVKRNYIKNAADTYLACFDQHNWGGTPFYDTESKVWRNVCVGGSLMQAKPYESGSALGNPFLTLKYNLAVDPSTVSAYDDGVHHPMYTFPYYTDAAGLALTAGKFSTTSNCIYLSGGAGFKGAYGGGSGFGTAYSSFASWQSAGFDSSSFSESFTVGTDGAVTGSTNCAAFGVFGDSGATTTTTATTTSSTTTSATTTTSVAPTATNIGGLAVRYQ